MSVTAHIRTDPPEEDRSRVNWKVTTGVATIVGVVVSVISIVITSLLGA